MIKYNQMIKFNKMIKQLNYKYIMKIQNQMNLFKILKI